MRRRYLIAYDIRDDHRLREVARCMEEFGTRVQYSVFVSDLSQMEFIHVRGNLMSLMNQAEDSVMIIDLGMAGDTSRFQFLGVHDREMMPKAGALVI